jgi:23S rRNA pseudouridine2457 synthase
MSRYLVFYKPFEVLSQFTDTKGRQTLKEYIHVGRVYAAGRLDYRSEGMLLLTDDGALIHRLTSPRYEHPKTYLAQVEGLVSEKAIRRLNEEIVLPGLQTKTARARIILNPHLPPRPTPVRNYHPTTWMEIILQEGKKHQVRRMTAAVGYPTLRLVRIAIGSLKLGQLNPGEWRYLTPEEIRSLKRETRKRG